MAKRNRERKPARKAAPKRKAPKSRARGLPTQQWCSAMEAAVAALIGQAKEVDASLPALTGRVVALEQKWTASRGQLTEQLEAAMERVADVEEAVAALPSSEDSGG